MIGQRLRPLTRARMRRRRAKALLSFALDPGEAHFLAAVPGVLLVHVLYEGLQVFEGFLAHCRGPHAPFASNTACCILSRYQRRHNSEAEASFSRWGVERKIRTRRLRQIPILAHRMRRSATMPQPKAIAMLVVARPIPAMRKTTNRSRFWSTSLTSSASSSPAKSSRTPSTA
jgi:hypothetical protein